jgi:uncharacterized coiled-coil protein SlyX
MTYDTLSIQEQLILQLKTAVAIKDNTINELKTDLLKLNNRYEKLKAINFYQKSLLDNN